MTKPATLANAPDELVDTILTTDTIASISGKPIIDLQLDQMSYKSGDTVRIKSLWISNPSQQQQLVEAKTWIALSNMQPVSLDALPADDTISLPPGFNQDYGTTPILIISKTSPLGTGLVGARLLNPVTGDAISEDRKLFSIHANGSNSTVVQLIPAAEPLIVLERSDSPSGITYTVVNNDSISAEVEVKIWMDNVDGSATSIFVAGADGAIKLSAGNRITLHTQSSAPNLKARVLETATGTILDEE